MGARDVVESMVGGSHPPAVWNIALDALVAETRAESAGVIVKLEQRSERLAKLEAAGVDNWEGYGHALRDDDEDEDEWFADDGDGEVDEPVAP